MHIPVPNGNFALFSILLLGVLGFAFAKSRGAELKGSGWAFLRTLFPSWRFFEDLNWVPKLDALNLERMNESWSQCVPDEKRSLMAVVLNPRGNLRLALQSALEQLASELADLPEGAERAFAQSVSYGIVRQIAQNRLMELGRLKRGDRYQFRISSTQPGPEEDSSKDELFISAVHEA